MSLLLCLPYFPSFSHFTFIFSSLFVYSVVWRRHALSACSGLFFFPFFYIVILCVCVCVFVSCVLRGSFRLIKEMIYRSTMLEELPDRSSNRVFSNELSPLNHRQPQKLTPKTHNTCTHVYTQREMYSHTYNSTVHPHSWKVVQLLPTNQCPYISESLSENVHLAQSFKLDYFWYFWTLLDRIEVLKKTFGLTSSIHFTCTFKIFSSIHSLIKIWNQSTIHVMSSTNQTSKI